MDAHALLVFPKMHRLRCGIYLRRLLDIEKGTWGSINFNANATQVYAQLGLLASYYN
jgi:hypothetical protein